MNIDKQVIKARIISGKIENHNFDGLCSEEYCSKKYSQYIKLNLNNVELIIGLCDEHAEQIECI
jgi:hypothetical protein